MRRRFRRPRGLAEAMEHLSDSRMLFGHPYSDSTVELVRLAVSSVVADIRARVATDGVEETAKVVGVFPEELQEWLADGWIARWVGLMKPPNPLAVALALQRSGRLEALGGKAAPAAKDQRSKPGWRR